jgi:integrase
VATITKTPSKTWKAIVRKRGWPTTIKTFRTKRDAEDWARSTEDEMVRGVYIDRTEATQLLLKKAFDRYLREVSTTKKASTQAAEKHKVKALKTQLGDYSLAALNPGLIAQYRDDRLAAGKSADTVRLELALLSHLFTIAIKEWRLGLIYNPVMNIRKPPPGQGRNRRLSADEETTLLEACDKFSNPMLGWIVRTALFTAMRAGEITSLRRDQVDLARRVIRLTDTKNGSARTVPLTHKAENIFRMALSNPARPFDTDLIFWGEPGRDRKRRPYEFRMAWKKIIKDTKINNLRFHDLRHEAVSRLVEAGLGDQEVAAISGHKSMQMLMRYTHLRAEDLVERLDQVMG